MTKRLSAIVFLLSACGVNSQGTYSQMRAMLVQEKYADAANFIEGHKQEIYGENNAVLFYMDKLMALHLAKRFKESNDLINKASDKIEELYTTSVSRQAAAILTSDNVIPFEGEDFEKVLIHVVGALNYTFMGDKEGAMVEARRVEEKLTALNERALKGAQNDREAAARQLAQYSEDAFVRWFVGCLFETENDEQSLNDALIAYKKALEAYERSYTPKYRTPVPHLLVADLLRAAQALGFSEDIQATKAKYPTVAVPEDVKGKGEVVLVHLNGEAPYKYERHWEAIADNKIIKVAYPEFRVKPKGTAYATLRVGDTVVRTELFEDVNAIAIGSLMDRMGRVKAKMIARAIAKFLAAKATEVGVAKASGNSGLGALFGAAASVAGAATEKADLRSWLLLPSSIDVAKAYVPVGKHKVTVTLHSASGGVLRTLALPDVEVRAGKKTFLQVRTY